MIHATGSRQMRSQRGMVTAELAIGIAGLSAMTMLLLGGVSLVGDHLTCQAGAAEIARQLARGDEAAAHSVAEGLGADTREVVVRGDTSVSVTVIRPVRLLGRWGDVTVTAEQSVRWEPGEGDG